MSIDYIIKLLLTALKKGSNTIRLLIGFGVLLLIIGLVALALVKRQDNIATGIKLAVSFFGFIIAMAAGVSVEINLQEQSDAKIERKEENFEKNPEKPQLAWDLARSKLEKYLDKNLAQVQAIFSLSIFVMLIGFGLVVYGVLKSFSSPNINAAGLSVVAGLILNFIGASFLLIYKSTMKQAKEFVKVIERINAVGMSVQILENIKDDGQLKDKTSAQLVQKLLELYSKD